ncbi:MAG: ATP-binding protein [Minisyncoccia bacterium]|jgi:predicted kinase
MAVLFVTVGVPGSGKSYFAEKLCKERGLVHLRSDKIRDIVFPKPTYKPGENNKLFGLIDFLVVELLSKGVGVVYDANFTKKIHRTEMARIAKKNGAQYAVLWIKTPLSVALKRVKARKYHKIGKRVVFGIHEETEYPHNEPVVVLDGTKSYRSQKRLFKQYFRAA